MPSPLLPINPSQRAWLQAEGSLTARLRQHGRVDVVVLRQGPQRLWPQEQADLACRSGHVREVALLVNGVPAVWARSATSHEALRGPWKALANLGSRPLAELLFQRRQVDRSPLRPHHLLRHGPEQGHLRQAWLQLQVAMPADSVPTSSVPAGPTPRWARSSVFWHGGQPLRVLEVFAPWLLQMDAAAPRR